MKSIIIIFLIIILSQMLALSAVQHLSKEKQTPIFIENKGQWPPEVKFLAKATGINAWIKTDGIVFDFYKITKNSSNSDPFNKFILRDAQKNKNQFTSNGHIIKMDYAQKDEGDKILCNKTYGVNRVPQYFNYFYGNNKVEWTTHVPAYNEVVSEGIEKLIDIKYYFEEGNLRYDYIIHPGADLSDIKMKFNFGDNSIYTARLNLRGELILHTSIGDIIHTKLFAYQENPSGNRSKIECNFKVNNDGSIGFNASNYDKTKILIIDPLIFSTFLGGDGQDIFFGYLPDQQGNHILTGQEWSSNFPYTPGSYQNQLGNLDAFITKISSDGSGIIFSTIFGGSSYDGAGEIVYDEYGNIIILGGTSSIDFPLTEDAIDLENNEAGDAFLVKFNEDCTELLYSTFFGGSGYEGVGHIKICSNNDVVIMGMTDSYDLKVTPSAFDQSFGGGYDAFVTKFNPDLNSLIYSTYIGGVDYDGGWGGLDVDIEGNAYITGCTFSYDYPVTANAYNYFYIGNGDIILSVISSDGSDLIYSSFLGGSMFEQGYDLKLTNDNKVVILGGTSSEDYPATVDAFDATYNGGNWNPLYGVNDLSITIFNPDLSNIDYSTYIGGSSSDAGTNLFLKDNGDIYFSSLTQSPDFPITDNAIDNTLSGNYDITLSILDINKSLVYSTYFGGYDGPEEWKWEQGYILLAEPYLLVGGFTYATDFPITDNAVDKTCEDADIFLSAIDLTFVYPISTIYPGDYNAIISSKIWSDNSIIVRGVCYGAESSPTVEGFHTHDGNSIGDFHSELTGLIPQTQYFVRAYATNINGTVYGPESVFTTQADINPPQANCKDFTLYLPQIGVAEIQASDIDDNSYDEGGIASLSVNPSIFTCSNVGQNDLILTLIDNYGNSSTCSAIVTVVNPDLDLTISVNPSPAVTNGQPNTIYLGFGPTSLTLTATDGYTYKWKAGVEQFSTNRSVTISPTTSTTYTLIATNENDCTKSTAVVINVVDVRAGKNGNQIYICHRGSTMRVSANAVQAHLNHGDYLGECHPSKNGDYNETIAGEYSLSDNFPNPFTMTTKIEYCLPENGFVELKVYDIYSREIETLVSRLHSPGHYDVEFDGSKLPSGVYTYCLLVNGISMSRTMVIIK